MNNVEWPQTELVGEVIKAVESGNDWVWKGCESEQDVYNECERYDELYKIIQEERYKTQLELLVSGKRKLSTFPRLYRDEIVVDVDSDGELLLVGGRHRLSIAKLLGLDSIPITFAYRHRDWMEYRDEVATTDQIPDHPDLRDLS